MKTDSFVGLPWWQWALIVLVAAAVALFLRQRIERARKRHETERLARQADANHEGARTRHEGGA
jgi:hypothetical protein